MENGKSSDMVSEKNIWKWQESLENLLGKYINTLLIGN